VNLSNPIADIFYQKGFSIKASYIITGIICCAPVVVLLVLAVYQLLSDGT
jgi:hypothetical protein